MAKSKKAKSERIPNRDRVLTFDDLTKKEQKDTVALKNIISETMPAQMAQKAESHLKSSRPEQVKKGERYAKASEKLVAKPMTMDSMVSARKNAFGQALAGDVRQPEEDYAGQGFYFKHRGELDDIASITNLPVSHIAGATARLSVQTKPESEKASLRALSMAHAHGTMNFTPDVVNALRSSGAKVSEDLHGKKVPFRDLPAEVVQHVTNPKIRARLQPHAHGVDIDNLAKSSMRANIKQAHEVLQGQGLDPIKNPKLFSYAHNHDIAVPNSAEQKEYEMRGAHVGKAKRGEIAGGQEMFDFYGLRDSNEGVLSNRLPTPNDSWMLANEYDQPQGVRKVAGDVNLSAKSGKTKRGREISVGMDDATISAAGLQHSLGNEVTHRVAKETQEELNLGFTVPAMMVQEGTWAAERRNAGGDTDVKVSKREKKDAEKAQEKAAKQEATLNPNRQLDLFDEDHNKQVAKDVKKADKLQKKLGKG